MEEAAAQYLESRSSHGREVDWLTAVGREVAGIRIVHSAYAMVVVQLVESTLLWSLCRLAESR